MLCLNIITVASFLRQIDNKSDSWTQLIILGEGLDFPVRFKLDYGADVSVVPIRWCALVTVRHTSKRLIAPSNMIISVLGGFDSVLREGSLKHAEGLYVGDQTNGQRSMWEA